LLSISTELTAQELLSLTWDDLKPYYQALENTRISSDNLNEWLGGLVEPHHGGDGGQ